MTPDQHVSAPLLVDRVNEHGSFAGYASLFNIVDDQGDSIAPGAFSQTLRQHETKGSWPKMLWQHQTSEPIGVWTFMGEDEKGLYVEGQLLLDVQRGREAYTLIKSGALDGLSIGFRVKEAFRKEDAPVRIISEAELLEVSIVTFAANTQAKITAIKEAGSNPFLPVLRSLARVEKILREEI